MIDKINLTDAEIQENYQEFLKFVGDVFTGKRKEKLLKMYSDAEDSLGLPLATAPASMCEHFHLCHPGGYAQHIMNVIRLSFASKKLFEIAGATIDFTDDQMIFAAMHHDLGKLGDPEFGEYYAPQDQDWKYKKGEFYRMNPNLPYMEVTDRAIFLLQKYGITYDWKEYLGIKLSDGLFNENNEKYLKQYNPDLYLKTNLPRIIHCADYTACRAEYDKWYHTKADEKL
ncbi:MAG: hypothetical protein ABSA74_04060 [Candidatus Staskawiczbacteria bacterium]|jgi:hypothetical protein